VVRARAVAAPPGPALRVRSILFVELLGGLGDLLVALPAIHALARSHPGARVTVLTFAPGDQLLAEDPHVAEVVVARPGPPERQREAVERVSARGFDLIVSDTRYGGIPQALAASGAGRVVDDLWRTPPPSERIDLRFLALLADDGVIAPAYRTLPPKVTLTPAEHAEAERRLAALDGGTRPRVLLLPEAGMSIKEWAPARFRALAQELVREGCSVLLAAADDRAPRAIAAGVRGAAVVPPVSLRGLGAVAAASAACVAGDTGPARLAAAVGTPTVALFGPSWAGRFGLRDTHVNLQSPLPCDVRNPHNMTEQPCWYTGLCIYDDRRTCTDELSVDQVLAAVRALLPLSGGAA
jgi:ADP-heptose:LPS heptosyltransferase